MAGPHATCPSEDRQAGPGGVCPATAAPQGLRRPLAPRDARGRFRKCRTALERFLSKCRFDPATGCVVWIGGKTRGRGKTSWYGSFWFEGRRWTAHRWAARFILGLEIDGHDVDHCCPHTRGGPNTLCIRHLQPVSGRVNTALYWIRVQVGLEPEPPVAEDDPDDIPFFTPPDWFPVAPAPADPPF